MNYIFTDIDVSKITTVQQAFDTCTGQIDTSTMTEEEREIFAHSIQTMFYSGMAFALTMVVENERTLPLDIAKTRTLNMLREAFHWLTGEEMPRVKP